MMKNTDCNINDLGIDLFIVLPLKTNIAIYNSVVTKIYNTAHYIVYMRVKRAVHTHTYTHTV